MSKNITHLYNITPDQFKTEILNGISEQLQEFSKIFEVKEPAVWITLKETAELLGVTVTTIHNWKKQQIIKDYKIGSRVRFNRNEIEQILKNSSL